MDNYVFTYAEALTRPRFHSTCYVTDIPDDQWCVNGHVEYRDALVRYLASQVIPPPATSRRFKIDPVQQVFANEDLVAMILDYTVEYDFDYLASEFPFKCVIDYSRDPGLMMSIVNLEVTEASVIPYDMRFVPGLKMCSFNPFDMLVKMMPAVRKLIRTGYFKNKDGRFFIYSKPKKFKSILIKVDSDFGMDAFVNADTNQRGNRGFGFYFGKSETTGRWCLKAMRCFYHLTMQNLPRVFFHLKE